MFKCESKSVSYKYCGFIKKNPRKEVRTPISVDWCCSINGLILHGQAVKTRVRQYMS
jgi:hypothetical protein